MHKDIDKATLDRVLSLSQRILGFDRLDKPTKEEVYSELAHLITAILLYTEERDPIRAGITFNSVIQPDVEKRLTDKILRDITGVQHILSQSINEWLFGNLKPEGNATPALTPKAAPATYDFKATRGDKVIKASVERSEPVQPNHVYSPDAHWHCIICDTCDRERPLPQDFHAYVQNAHTEICPRCGGRSQIAID